jgi:hypothetical protein
MKTGTNTEVPSSKSADNRDERKLPPSGSPTKDAAFEPIFIDGTEENSAIIISGVFEDQDKK